MEQDKAKNRDFSTISPSARWILIMKGHTDIPFARQTAELIRYPEKFEPESEKKDLNFWIRTWHFESRYWSIDQLLADQPTKNILEVSGGFSFRGLDLTRQKDVYYIDTDLPEMTDKKRGLAETLDNEPSSKKGTLEFESLNALDQLAFDEITSRFPPGEIAIVNEGLLVYLDETEKEKLCANIRKVLEKRGGYWITADIYIKLAQTRVERTLDDRTKKFFEDHHVEENRFASFEVAEQFFNRMGFVIDKEAKVDYTALSAFKQVMKLAKGEDFARFGGTGKIHATWLLRLADK